MVLKTLPLLVKISLCLFCAMAGILALYLAKAVLVPLTFAVVFATLLIPLCRRLENAGWPRWLAATACILILMISFVLIFGLLGWQLTTVLQDAGQIKQRIAELATQVQVFIANKTGIKPWEQNKMLSKNDMSAPLGFVAQGTGMLLGLLLDLILTLVYIFLLIYFRSHFLKFVTRAVPEGQQADTTRLIKEAGVVSQQYLLGLSLMILCLWIMYSIGFSLIGVQYAIFFAMLCGTLEMVPFVGNITGSLLTAIITLANGGSWELIGGILVVYGVVQFVQSYCLEPLVVGRSININPFFTILSLVIGEAVWGIPGMILALPLCGMLKITCDHFDSLKPYGFLLGGSEKKGRK